MKHLGVIQTAACAALVLAAFSQQVARGDEWNDRTIVTFSNTVQVPGTILPAGTYVFKVLESPGNRYVVQISNERESHLFATLIAIPDSYMTREARRDDPLSPTEETTLITFYEAPAGQPEPIKEWIYPGDNYGRRFVYSKAEAELIAKTAHENVSTQ